jgi:uncharacterized protein YciI
MEAMHYLLFYSFVDGMAERRGPYRKAHLMHLEAAVARGELILAGAFADPLDGSVFLFQGSSPAAAEALAQTDPYVVNGLVTRWHVRTWSTVVGRDAATPVASSSLP